MDEIKTILFPTDLSEESITGFRWAAALASWHGAIVHVLHVVPTSPLSDPVDLSVVGLVAGREKAFYDYLEAHMPEELHALDVRRIVREGYSVVDEILRYAGEHDVDLIIMGTHGHRSLLRPSLGGTSGGVLRQAACPVLTWRAGQESTVPPAHILAPVDFSEHSERMLAHAKRWAAHFRARLSALFVAEQRVVPIFSDLLLPSIHVIKMEADQIERAGQALEQLAQRDLPAGVEAQSHVRVGHAAHEILDFIEEQGVDLVMISSHGLTGSGRYALGGTSEKVIRKAPCAILTERAAVDTEGVDEEPDEARA